MDDGERTTAPRCDGLGSMRRAARLLACRRKSYGMQCNAMRAVHADEMPREGVAAAPACVGDALLSVQGMAAWLSGAGEARDERRC